MTKPAVLALMCTSTFALSGCIGLLGVGIGAIADSGKGEKAEKEQFNQLVKKLAELEQKHTQLPDDLEDLKVVHTDWDNMYDAITNYRESDSFAYKKIGSCLADKERKASDRCKKAKAMQAKVATKIAGTLHAAIKAEPVLGMEFPLWDIAYSQRDPALAAAVNVEESLEKLTQHMSEHFTKRVRKAGGAETFARKENAGMCFFSSRAQGDDIQPQFSISGNAEQLHVHCVAPDAFANYDRTEKDIVDIDMVNRSRTTVKQLPGDHASGGSTFADDLAMAQFRKAAKAKGTEREKMVAEQSGDKSGKPWRFSIVEVRYLVSKKVGETARRVGDQIRVEDDIRTQEVATGLAVIDNEAPADENVDADADAEADADEAPKPTKKKTTKVAKKGGKAKGRKGKRR